MILEIFIDFFFIKIVVGWSKNICNLIITVRFNFGANLTVRYFLNRCNQPIIVESSQDFKSYRLNISSIYSDLSLYIFYISRYIFYISRYI